MDHLDRLIQQGTLHFWFYIPTAILLGALHGLEPGHSKTMMVAFIIAIRGTVFQAVILGLSAAFSHSLAVWVLAGLALEYGSQWNAESTEPYFQVGSAAIIIGLALWMAWRTHRDIKAESEHGHHHHGQNSGGEIRVPTGHGAVKVEIFEQGVPPVFRLRFDGHGVPAKLPDPQSVSLETLRPDGTVQVFAFGAKEDFLESTAPIPEPHEFTVTLSLSHGDRAHRHVVAFTEGHSHVHGGGAYQDAHELAHATEIEKRFADRNVTTGQIALFGFTGGLLPCPAAFTVVLVCLQLKRIALGIAMVLAFSAGLAFTLVATGALAAWSLRHAEKRFSGLGSVARKLPYLSSGILTLMGLFIGIQGWLHLARLH